MNDSTEGIPDADWEDRGRDAETDAELDAESGEDLDQDVTEDLDEEPEDLYEEPHAEPDEELGAEPYAGPYADPDAAQYARPVSSEAPAVTSLFVGALAGALVLGLVWFTVAMLDEDDPTATEARSSVPDRLADPDPVGSAVESPPAVTPTRMDRCVQADDRVSRSLSAAVPAMEQWEVHVGAMNKLVVGAISLQQATDFWNQTRLAAKRKIGDYEDAHQVVRREGVDCPVAERLGRASKELRACALHVDADLRAINLAGTAIDTWSEHVEDMDMLRMGHLSPADATEAWLASWQQGVREIQAYEGAARAARQTGGC